MYGALVESPQFALQGIAPRGGDVPLLTAMSARYDAVCAELARTGVVRCTGETLELTGRAAAPVPLRVPAVHEIGPRRGIPDLRRQMAPTTSAM